jgi:hypothetical protein
MRRIHSMLFVMMLLGCTLADTIVVMPFYVQPGTAPEYASFAKIMSDTLRAITNVPTLYFENGAALPADSVRQKPNYVAVGEATGATLLLWGQISQFAGRPQCMVELYDAAAKRVCFSYTFGDSGIVTSLSLASFAAPRIALFCPLSDHAREVALARVKTGSVFVRTNPPAAAIYIDSALTGTSPRVLEKVFCGKHRIFLKRENETAGKDVVVRPFRMENVLVNFPSSTSGKSDQTSKFTTVLRSVTLAGACIGAGAAIYFYNQRFSQKDTYTLASGCVGGALLIVFCVTFMY